MTDDKKELDFEDKLKNRNQSQHWHLHHATEYLYKALPLALVHDLTLATQIAEFLASYKKTQGENHVD
tara:strand:- start:1589 stop:1792 length:204 start_codon:yes stop_codon:yes gene_type:complete